MAAANAVRNRGRTALTASALMVGISLVVAFSALGGSVLGSIQTYLDGSLGADFVVRPSNDSFDVSISPELEEMISEMPGVEEATGVASTTRRDGGETSLVFGVDERYPAVFRPDYATGTSENAFLELEDGGALVGPQLARQREIDVGDEIELQGPTGTRSYPVAGIIENDLFGLSTGIYLSKDTLARDFNETESEFLALKAAPDADQTAIQEEAGRILEDYPQLALYSNAEWKGQIESDFDRQYVFFYAIMGVSVAVSAFGVVNTLSMSVFERTREIGVLRAIGTTRLQVGRLIIDEGVVISLIGCLVGVVVRRGGLRGRVFLSDDTGAPRAVLRPVYRGLRWPLTGSFGGPHKHCRGGAV
jgi:putative ABC transport system permease protein